MSDQPPEPGSQHDLGGAEPNQSAFQTPPEQQVGQHVGADETAPTASGGTAPFTEQELRPEQNIPDQAVKQPLESNEDPGTPGPSTTFAPKEGDAIGTDELREQELAKIKETQNDPGAPGPPEGEAPTDQQDYTRPSAAPPHDHSWENQEEGRRGETGKTKKLEQSPKTEPSTKRKS